MTTPPLRESDLYGPIKQFLQAQGYEVKAEIGPSDVFACRGAEEPVIVELKTGFSLTLFHQGVERQAISDQVYIAVPRGSGKVFSKTLKNNLSLCRRLGLGLLTVRVKDGFVEAHIDPASYKPRKSKTKTNRLLREFSKRVGDPNVGGVTRTMVMTAYRQDALRCANYLQENGPQKGAIVANAIEVEKATRLMADDHYGWFERVSLGIYGLTPKGIEAIGVYRKEIDAISSHT